MRWTKKLIPTLKEDPSDAEVLSHKLLVRAGFIRQLSAGIYNFLPLGWRSMLKIIQIIREEMNRIGAQEIYMPALNPVEIWEQTGRAKDMAEIMFRFKDRRERENVLAPTHEEVIAYIAKHEIRSFRDLPQSWYQIQEKFRDEPRPRFGLLRVREFFMKDSYSLCATAEQLDKEYKKHAEAYNRIFKRCGLRFIVVSASSGLMGGKESQEFMVPSDAGEDVMVFCDKCDYAANVEIAEGIPQSFEHLPIHKKERIHTPNLKTVEEVSEFLGLPQAQMFKSLVYVCDNKPVMVLLRGDYQLNEEKLARFLNGAVRPAHTDEVQQWLGAPVGFIGPLDIPKEIRVIVDDACPNDIPFATGANEADYHIRGWKLSEIRIDDTGDFRIVKTGDRCKKCGGTLQATTTIEIGHIFKLGTKYSEAIGATFMDSDGVEKPIIMGSYGIGVGRILASAVELYADKDGISLPITIAPFEVILTALDMTNHQIVETSERLYHWLEDSGVEVLYDDRDERAGVKFKDADLIGIPIRIVIGKKVENGIVEISVRKTGEKFEVPVENAMKHIEGIRVALYQELSV